MKTRLVLYVLVNLSLILTYCEKPIRDNPWDEKTDLDPQQWAPKNFVVEENNILARTLKWGYGLDYPIKGFTIDRKRGNENWVEAYAKTEKGTTSFLDTITPDQKTLYQYKLYAYAGPNKSSILEQSSLATVPAPSNLIFSVNSFTSVTLSWDYNLTGHEGFQIGRKTNDGEWIIISTNIKPNIFSFTDSQIDLEQNNYTYRLNAFALNFFSDYAEINLSIPTVTTANVTNPYITSGIGGGNVTAQGSTAVTRKGVCWSTSPSPTIADNQTNDGSGIGSFTSLITGLSTATTYYVRAYAINLVGTAYGEQVYFTTQYDYCEGVTPPEGYGVVSSSGKCWLDRNLGASQIAQYSLDAQAYGDLYQWGRRSDGHEKRTSNTTSTLSSSNTPSHGKFILAPNSPDDWRSPQNDNLWQGANGINNPCPPGYRLPTPAEWEAEHQSWSSNSAFGAFNSPLKLTLAGYRLRFDGSVYSGVQGSYWSAAVDGMYVWNLGFSSSGANMYTTYRANGGCVRCLKD